MNSCNQLFGIKVNSDVLREIDVVYEHLFNLTRRYKVLILLSGAFEHIEALFSFLQAVAFVSFDSNHMLAKGDVNTVVLKECLVGTA